MARLALTDMQESAGRKYGPLEVQLPDGTLVVLHPVLRLPKQARKEMSRLLEKREERDAEIEAARTAAKEAGEPEPEFDDDEAVSAVYSEAILIAGKRSDAVRRLLDEIGDDIAVLKEVFDEYNKQTQPGEADTSGS